jgi:quinolinate synthase
MQERIRRLKIEKKAILLTHNYQRQEIQEVADILGDSLGLARHAEATDAEIIVFCGVHFMAQTAAVLNPEKRVLLPDIRSGCPMADMINHEKLAEIKQKYPEAVILSYVNTSAEVKAPSDWCCTSANAEKVVRAIPEDREIIFIPDRSLGAYVMEQTGRKIRLYDGFCPVHHRITPADVVDKKHHYPDAVVLAHPECSRDVRRLADHVLSTGGMVRIVRESDHDAFIVATENGINHRLRTENPGKTIIDVSEISICPNMKIHTIEKVLNCLETEQYEVRVDPEIARKARIPIERMLSLG